MTYSLETILKIIILGIGLSMDAFAVSITDGLIYSDINKKKATFIAATFGIMQAIMPIIGYFLIELIQIIVGQAGQEQAVNIMKIVVTWVAFTALIVIGGKMIFEAVKALKSPKEERVTKLFSYKQVLLFGVATSIDALTSGIVLHSGLSLYSDGSLFVHASIIMAITFTFSIVGVIFGHFFEKLLKGKYEVANIIGGSILIILAIWIVISNMLGL